MWEFFWRPRAVTFGSKPLLVTQIAHNGLNTRLTKTLNDLTDDQFTKYLHTFLHHRFYLDLLCLSSGRNSGPLTVKFSLNPITTQKVANLQKTAHACESSFLASLLLSDRRFRALTVKSSLNTITTQKMTNLQNNVRRLWIIVINYSYSAYHLEATLLSFQGWNSHLTPLRPKRWPISTMLSHVSKSSLFTGLTELIISSTFWISYGEICTQPHYQSKDGKFAKG